MMNPASLFKLVGYKNQFEKSHPKFYAFLLHLLSQRPEVGTVIEMKLVYPDGRTVAGNMRIQQSDLDLIEELKNFQKGNK